MTRLRSRTAISAVLVLSAGIAAGATSLDGPEAVGVDPIEHMTWLLTSQIVEGQITPVPEGVVVSLRMEGGDAGGSGGCNSYFTSYELHGFDLAFGAVGSTMMACMPPLMGAEQAYYANLGLVASYRSDGGGMTLLDASGDVLLAFDLAPAATVTGSWVATGINDQSGGVVTQEITSEVTAAFEAGGDLTGFDGCNDYVTTYVVVGDSITVDPMVGRTKVACPSDEHARQAEAYLTALTGAVTWSVDAAGNLELRDAEGALQVAYVPGQ